MANKAVDMYGESAAGFTPVTADARQHRTSEETYGKYIGSSWSRLEVSDSRNAARWFLG